MITKAQELAKEICTEIDDDDSGEEILRDLANGLEATDEVTKWVEKMAEDNGIDEERIWKVILEFADTKVAEWDKAKDEEATA